MFKKKVPKVIQDTDARNHGTPRNLHPAERAARARRCVRAFSARGADRDGSFGPSSCGASRGKMRECVTFALLCVLAPCLTRSLSKQNVWLGGNGRSIVKNNCQMHFPSGARNIALELQVTKVKETENCTVFLCSPRGNLDKLVALRCKIIFKQIILVASWGNGKSQRKYTLKQIIFFLVLSSNYRGGSHCDGRTDARLSKN